MVIKYIWLNQDERPCPRPFAFDATDRVYLFMNHDQKCMTPQQQRRLLCLIRQTIKNWRSATEVDTVRDAAELAWDGAYYSAAQR